MAERIIVAPGQWADVHLPDGAKVMIKVYDDKVTIYGAGDNHLGKLAIEPAGSNVFDLRVIA